MDLACWLWKKDPGFQNKVREETSPYFLLGTQDQRLVAELDQFPCGSTGISSSNCQEIENCMVQAYHMPWQPLQNHPSGHLGGDWCRDQQRQCWMDNIKEWTSLPWQELLTGAFCRKDRKMISAESFLCPPDDPVSQRAELNWTNRIIVVILCRVCLAWVLRIVCNALWCVSDCRIAMLWIAVDILPYSFTEFLGDLAGSIGHTHRMACTELPYCNVL